MELTVYANAFDFLHENRSFLEHEEALNNLILGQSEALLRPSVPISKPPVFIAIKNRRGPSLVALQNGDNPTVFYGLTKLLPESLPVLKEFAAEYPSFLDRIIGPQKLLNPLANQLERMLDRKHRMGICHILYQLKETLKPSGGTGTMREANTGDQDLVTHWFQTFYQDAFGNQMDESQCKQKAIDRIDRRQLFLWETELEVVAMGAIGRQTRKGMAINYVFTPRAARKKGYASQLVAALSQHVLDQGFEFCTLFTDKNNATTNKIYRLIGYEPVANFVQVLFD